MILCYLLKPSLFSSDQHELATLTLFVTKDTLLPFHILRLAAFSSSSGPHCRLLCGGWNLVACVCTQLLYRSPDPDSEREPIQRRRGNHLVHWRLAHLCLDK